jgi:predicted dithiol-disulfide oxidoreductase (DUF899 family)
VSLPPVVSEAQWQTARDELLAEEKAMTRALDALASKRRRLPMVRWDKPYVFEGPGGSASLADLFEGRRQLIVYNFMLAPGSDYVCGGCASFTDNIPHLDHMNARDTTYALVSRGEMFGLSVFLRDGDDVYRTYFTTSRGVDRLRVDFNLLDLTPLGRQEEWEDSPEGWPQDPTMSWLRLRDEYAGATIS